MTGADNIKPNDDIANAGQVFQVQLTDVQFKKLSTFLQSETGIKLPEVKKTMLQSRLHKRLRALNMDNFNDYISYAMKKGNEQEIVNMIDVVSTNKTDFFREPAHFDFLSQQYLPYFLEQSGNKHLKMWSAASSSGEEPYTIAIVLEEFKKKNAVFNYSVFATDISTQMLDKCKKGIYNEDKVNELPISIKKQYFLKSIDRKKPTVKVASVLQKNISWQRLNLMDSYYNVNENFDIIMCRNVLIYFERCNQENVINKLCRHLKPGGIFILGHSESIINMQVPLKQIKPTIYKKL